MMKLDSMGNYVVDNAITSVADVDSTPTVEERLDALESAMLEIIVGESDA